VIAPALLTAAPPTADSVVLLCAAAPLIALELVSVAIVPEAPTPPPPSALVAPVAFAVPDRPTTHERHDQILDDHVESGMVDRARVFDGPRGATARRRKERYADFRGDGSAAPDRDVAAVALNS
jgi:hypothetical protein